MRTLLLLRHAKSDWDASYADDHERPLAKRGKKAAALIGRHLAATGQVPDRVVSSTAVRAADTVRRAMRSCLASASSPPHSLHVPGAEDQESGCSPQKYPDSTTYW